MEKLSCSYTHPVQSFVKFILPIRRQGIGFSCQTDWPIKCEWKSYDHRPAMCVSVQCTVHMRSNAFYSVKDVRRYVVIRYIPPTKIGATVPYRNHTAPCRDIPSCKVYNSKFCTVQLRGSLVNSYSLPSADEKDSTAV